jgi:hypothetical protein
VWIPKGANSLARANASVVCPVVSVIKSTDVLLATDQA